jgi:hypothetical protein
MVMAMDWITAENERPRSPLYHKLDVTKLAAGGQSCGAMMSCSRAGDKRITTAVVSNSGVSGDNTTLFASYHAPLDVHRRRQQGFPLLQRDRERKTDRTGKSSCPTTAKVDVADQVEAGQSGSGS